jgi:hypothetical protein
MVGDLHSYKLKNGPSRISELILLPISSATIYVWVDMNVDSGPAVGIDGMWSNLQSID